MKKLISILVAFAMMASLAICMAFAEGETNYGIKAVDEEHPAKAALTKTLTAPNGVTPNETFTFRFSQAEDATKVKAIPDRTVEITTADLEGDANGATLTYIDRYDDILQDVTFPSAGVYEYTVAEVPGDVTKTVGKVTTTYTYSQDTYTLKVGVATKADGTTTYVESIAVYKNGEKVNASDGQDNDFNFNNHMTKKVDNVDPEGETPDPGPDPDNDDIALYIGKDVTAKEGQTAPTGQKFSFRLNLTKYADATAEQTYQAYIVDANGNKQGAGEDPVINVKTGEAYDFQLEDGWRLVFKNIDVGTAYTVTEADYPAYTKSGEVTTATYINDQASNGTTITNEYDKNNDPATGLSLNNLPFIVLALVAIGGLVAYVIVRRKSEDNA